jgi:hypothetical protein
MSETDSGTGIEGWAILELMGHRRLGGRVSEASIAGGAFIWIDIPHPNEAGIFTATQLYSPAAVYAITPTTEEIACAIARAVPGQDPSGARSPSPEPVSRWDLRALTEPAGETGLRYAIETIVSELNDAAEDD